jgi:sugar lactone lactonase YvrE
VKKRYSLRLLAFFLLTQVVGIASAQGPTSTIETVAGSADNNIPGTDFSFGGIAGLAMDSSGDIFFTIQPLSRVYRLGIDGQVTVYAGSGVRGQHRDGVAATASPLLNPASLAADATGNLYIAESGALLRVDANTGVLSTVFTTPYRPPGSPYAVRDVGRMTFGPSGLLYLCDALQIKSYSLDSGAVSLIAGNGKHGATQVGTDATSSPLKYPQSITIGADETVYFSTLEPVVYRVAQTGKLESISLRLPHENRELNDYDNPHSIGVDELGHLFVAQGNQSRILKIDLKSGHVSVYGGTGRQRFNGDGIKASLANITIPTDLAVDSAGEIVVAEQFRIRRIGASSQVIETIVGNGLPSSSAQTGPGVRAQLWEPANVFPAPGGFLYVTSSFSQRVLRVDAGGNVTTAAGGGDPVRFLEPGPVSKVSISYPQGLWVSESGGVFFSDNDNRIVRHLESGQIDSFATTPKNSNSFGLFLYYAAALVANADYFYLSDPNGHRVWRISRSDGSVEPYAGTGSDTETPEREDALSQRLAAPSGLALDSAGNLFIADGVMNSKLGRILRVEAGTGRVTTVLSNLRQPSGLAFQSPESLCFAESGANQIRCVNLANQSVQLIAGVGAAGYSGDGGPAECARLNRPSGINFDGAGRLYIADTGNQRVRLVRLGEHVASCR